MTDAKEKQAFYDELITRVNSSDRFAAYIGIRVLEVQEGYARLELPNVTETQNLFGALHGGAMSTLADTASGVAVTSLGRHMRVTVHNTMEYLRQAAPGPVQCVSRVRKAGSTITICEATVTDSQGQEVAIGTFSFFNTGQAI